MQSQKLETIVFSHDDIMHRIDPVIIEAEKEKKRRKDERIPLQLPLYEPVEEEPEEEDKGPKNTIAEYNEPPKSKGIIIIEMQQISYFSGNTRVFL